MTGREHPGCPAADLPRELVLASAGTGKTFTLSNRIIGLLALGVPPDTLLATTFTRKAAGEILNRVLSRLAEGVLDPVRARDILQTADLGAGREGESVPPQALLSRILLSLARDLHRVNVGTLDSFFVRVARSFPGELDLPPNWTIAHESRARRMESESLQEVLSEPRPGIMIELVRMSMRGESGRGVHQRLIRQLRELRGLLRQGSTRDPEALWTAPLPDARGCETPPTLEEVLAALDRAPLPLTKKGEPHRAFKNALSSGVEALRRGDWEGFCDKGLGKALLAGEGVFAGQPVPTGLREGVEGALALAARGYLPLLEGEARALRALAAGFDGALEKLQRREGAFGFQDITFLLGGLDPLGTRSDLWYRLDQRVRHILLDEFQDTSRAQWQALEPMVQELLAGDLEDRSGVVVADPKQSIYGWRGAEPGLVHRLPGKFSLQRRALTRSYRSSPTVLAFVNRVFGSLPDNPLWVSVPDLTPGVHAWWRGFPAHEAARKLPGFVRVVAGPAPEGRGRAHRGPFLAWAAQRIGELSRQLPGRSIGVLVRTNATAAGIVAILRQAGLDASEEGSSNLTDSPAVSAFLALFRVADHPGDTVARYHLARTPLGPLVGLDDHRDAAQARRVALELRRELMFRGFGPSLNRWCRALDRQGSLGRRDAARLRQLLELAHRWDQDPTSRSGDFVRFVETEALEAPTSARLRVMTVHKAKGLEFDAVVLPELEEGLSKGRGVYESVLPLQDEETGEVLRIFPRVPKGLRLLYPEVAAADRQNRERELQDALGVLYVALTRARHGLYLLTEAGPSGGSGKLPLTFSGLLRGALGWEEVDVEEGEVLYQDGEEGWTSSLPGPVALPEHATAPVRKDPSRIRLKRRETRSRFLPHHSPSGLEGLDEVHLQEILRLTSSRERSRLTGTVVHRWLESLTWMEDWDPDWGAMEAWAMERVPELTPGEVRRVREELAAWLGVPEVARALSRGSYPRSATPIPVSEVPFAVRLEGVIYQGRMDRVVLEMEGDVVVGAEVLDFKTNALQPGDEEALVRAAAEYRAQIGIYRRALAQRHGLSPDAIRAGLIFLVPGRVVEVVGKKATEDKDE